MRSILPSLYSDLRFALRQMRRSPGFASTVILTLALGIGANAVVFGILNALILRPLDLPQGRQLYALDLLNHDGSVSPASSYPDFLDLRARATTPHSPIEGLVASRINMIGLDWHHTSRQGWFYEASDNYFDVLGVKPALGRFFHPGDIHGAGSAPLAVLSYDLWHSQMDADPNVIGKTILLNQHPYTILGVAPPSFIGTELFFRPEIWVPMVQEQQLEGYDFLNSRNNHGIWLTGRLRPGANPQAAAALLNTVARQLAAQYPSDQALQFKLSRPGLIGDTLGRPVRAFLLGIMLLAALVFLAACANLGSLFSARAQDRARELSVRLALGSSRARILRQLSLEALLLSTLGAALGLALATLILRFLTQWSPPTQLPIHLAVNPGLSDVILTILLALLSGLFFGLIPASTLRHDASYQLIKTGTATGLRRTRFNLRSALLLLQIALCAVLVTAALVAVRGMGRALHAPIGIQPDQVTLASFDLSMIGHQTGSEALPIERQLADRAAALPGVQAVAFADRIPLNVDASTTSIYADTTTEFKPANEVTNAYFYDVTPGYLAAAGTHLLAGRDLSWHDDANSPSVALINRTLAHKLFASANPIGRYFRSGDGSRRLIVGLFDDGKYETLTEDANSAILYPLAQRPDNHITLLVRSGPNAAPVAGALANILRDFNPDLPITVQSWPRALATVLFPALAATVALGVMGLLAAMLALTGIFGMASHSVSQRLRELGIRIALGATRRQILAAALKQPLRLLAIGSVAGLILGALADRLLAVIVYQATSRDPVVLLGVLLGMILVGLLAAWLPARRALAIDPAILLRED